MSFWRDRSVLVTGASGFVGQHVMASLKARQCKSLVGVGRRDYDLTQPDQIKRLFEKNQPDIVIHLAARVGGIGANRAAPADFFFSNAVMGINLLHEAYLSGVEKFVAVGTICAYPKHASVPFREKDIWDGYPEETNAPYGIAKKILIVQSQAYRQQYQFNSIVLLPVNMYGPGDNCDPENSHVIPALILKCLQARANDDREIIVWGTGSVTREFIFVEDAVEAILLASERYNDSEPMNIGAGFEISIKDLVNKIKELTGFKGEINWDISRPDGQPRRMLDVTRARDQLQFSASTDFETGLKKTISWFEAQLTAPD